MTSKLQIHRPRIFSPISIPSISLAKNNSNTIAVGKDNGLIQLYQVDDFHKPQYKGQILSDIDSESSCLCFVAEHRLVSCGEAGQISLYDTISFTKLHEENISVACWQIEVSPTDPSLFAVACDDTVRLFKYQSESLELIRTFPVGGKSRTVSLAWSPDGKILAAGGIGKFTVWKIEVTDATIVPYELRTVKLSVSNQKPSSIWQIKLLAYNTLVTGDSSQRVIFWDLKTGTTISEFRVHEAPIISMEASEDKQTVYCSGSDSRIFEFNYSKTRKVWMEGSHYFTNSPYDITAFLLLNENSLLATRSNGNLDSFILKENNIQKSLELRVLPSSSSFIIPIDNLGIMTKDLYEINFFKLKSNLQSAGTKRKQYELETSSVGAHLTRVFQYKSNDVILTASMSETNMVVATKRFLKVYKIDGSCLEEVSRTQVFSPVTTITCGREQFYVGYGDGTLVGFSYDTDENQTVLKKRNSNSVVQKVLLKNSTIIFSTFQNQLRILTNVTSDGAGKSRDLPTNDEHVEYLNFKDESTITVGTSSTIMNINYEKDVVVESVPANHGFTLFFDEDMLVTNRRMFLNGKGNVYSSKKTARMFPMKTNQRAEILCAVRNGEKLFMFDQTIYNMLQTGPPVHDSKRRKFGR